MKYFLFLCFVYLWGLGCCGSNDKGGLFDFAVKGADTAASALLNIAKNTPVLQNVFPSHCVEAKEECPNENITFWYYSRSNPNNSMKLNLSNLEDLKKVDGIENPWKIIIHGYTKSKDEVPNPELRSAYLRHGQYNLISVDYEPLARDKCYFEAVKNTPVVAKCTAQMIDALIESNILKADNYHVIGFSLGAQIAGLIYEYLKYGKPSRVTGLDPAAPLFDGIINDKLTQNSGKFVDVIHTNALMKGKLETSGHVDFYVNGGHFQPGCIKNEKESFSTCSHNRSPLLFAESINSPEGFWGIPCSNSIKFYSGLCNLNEESQLVPMGESVPQTARGSYYLQTTNKEPFALGKLTRVTEN